MTKQIISLILALLMLLSMIGFTSCGDSGWGDDDWKASYDDDDEDEDEDEDEADENTEDTWYEPGADTDYYDGDEFWYDDDYWDETEADTAYYYDDDWYETAADTAYYYDDYSEESAVARW